MTPEQEAELNQLLTQLKDNMTSAERHISIFFRILDLKEAAGVEFSAEEVRALKKLAGEG